MSTRRVFALIGIYLLGAIGWNVLGSASSMRSYSQESTLTQAVQALWGIALFFLLWVLPVLKRALAQPFGIPFWALSFPLAAFTTLTLRLQELQGQPGGLMQTAAVLLLAATSVVVLWLCFATVRGLRDGSLLAPEPVAAITPVSA